MKRYHVTLEVELEDNVEPKNVQWGVPAKLCGFSRVILPGEPQTMAVPGTDQHRGMGEG